MPVLARLQSQLPSRASFPAPSAPPAQGGSGGYPYAVTAAAAAGAVGTNAPAVAVRVLCDYDAADDSELSLGSVAR